MTPFPPDPVRARRGFVRLAALTAFCCGAGLLGGTLAGCGSDSGTEFLSGSPLNPGGGDDEGGDAAFTGRAFRSEIAMDEGRKGTLDLNVAADGSASGTLAVEDLTRKASRLVVATPVVSGTVDPDTGAIDLSGGATINGVDFPIRITGALPNAGGGAVTGGTLSMQFGPFTYTSNWTVKVSGGTGGTGSGSTGSGNIPTGYVLAAAAAIPGTGGGKILTITCVAKAGQSDPSLIISVPYPSGGLSTGSFALDPDSLGAPSDLIVTYLEGGKTYRGGSGTVVIEEVGSKVRFRVENLVLREINGSGAKSLTGSGQTNVPFVDIDLGGGLPGLGGGGGFNFPGL